MRNKVLKKTDFYNHISEIIQNARKNIARTVDFEMVRAYWLIGKEIVEEEQIILVKALMNQICAIYVIFTLYIQNVTHCVTN